MRIIGYTFEADAACIECTRQAAKRMRQISDYRLMGEDSNGLPYSLVDREGSLLHPIYDIDEGNPTHCGTCREELGG